MISPLQSVLKVWDSPESGRLPTLSGEEVGEFLIRRVSVDAENLYGSSAAPVAEHVEAYAARTCKTIMLHLKKQDRDCDSPSELETIYADLSEGRLYYGQVSANVVHDVILAAGLELFVNKAAELFEREFMPAVRFQAERFLGQRGLDAVENLAADLVVPRSNRCAKIATYRGLTPLKSWLRSVVVNACTSAFRKRQPTEQAEEPGEPLDWDTVSATAQAIECEQKLAPAFQQAVSQVALEERVLLRMLILDGVPQNQLAASLAIDPGTLTRRKQRAATRLLEKIRSIGIRDERSTGVKECLELLLAGDSQQMRGRLASLLATEIGKSRDAGSGER